MDETVGFTIEADDKASPKVNKLTSSIFKAELSIKALATAWDIGVQAFGDGLKEIQEDEEALRRLGIVSKETGIAVGQLQTIAQSISADNLIELDNAMQGVADLAQKGFNTTEIQKMSIALKDIAASAGGNTQENFNKLTQAIISGRLQGAELSRMLPTLKTNLESAGVSMADMADESKKA